MNSKIIAGIIVIVLIVIAVYMFTTTTLPTGPTTGPTPTTRPTDVTTEATELSSVLGEEYSALILAELDKMSIEQTDFNSQVEEQMANDFSQFYYE